MAGKPLSSVYDPTLLPSRKNLGRESELALFGVDRRTVVPYPSLVQLIGKILLTLVFLGPAFVVGWVAVVATVRVWQGDIGTDWLNPGTLLRRRVEEATGRFVREPDAIYQNEKVVGRVRGAVSVDESAQRITFHMIFRAELFDRHIPFVFGRYRLLVEGDPVDVGMNFTEAGEPTGRTLDDVRWKCSDLI